MVTSCETDGPCQSNPLTPLAGAAIDSAIADSSNQHLPANDRPLVTIICSCGRRVSVDESEIRRAMTTILGFGEMLAQELSESEHAYAAEAIHRSGRQLLQMLCGVRG
ncbi:MAG: hypothetical protein GXX96_37170 [Planctomycetaceae bacterium]|nr:hypothetical protein [Planctomycetaceae bacterium]